MKSIFRPLILTLLLLAGDAVSAANQLTLYAVNYPLAYFAQRIGGDHVDVVFPVPAGIDPAFWQPDADDIASFQQADLILLNGAGYAKWLKRASLPRRKLVNTSAAFEHDYIDVNETVIHQHGPGGEHSHAGTAFTTWLDFNQATLQARAILSVLEQHDVEHAEVYRRNFALLEAELAELEKAIRNIVEQDSNKLLLASHPVYQYFARRYNIQLKSVMWEPDVVPDQNQWHELQQIQKNHDARWLIWEGEPEQQSVERLRAMGINSLVFDPGAKLPEEGDFMSLMKSNVTAIEKAYREQ